MGNLLSTSKRGSSAKVTQVDEAILDLKIARRNLVDTKKKQELLADRTLQTVKELLQAKRLDAARLALRKQKLHEQQYLQVSNYILRIDEQLVNVEISSQQADLVGVLRTANDAVKSIQRQMPLEEIEKLMDDTAESAQYVESVQTLLGQSTVEFDDSALENELDGFRAEVLQSQLADLPQAPENPEGWQEADEPAAIAGLPSPPTTEVDTAKADSKPAVDTAKAEPAEAELIPA